jgi:hypothetical protein
MAENMQYIFDLTLVNLETEETKKAFDLDTLNEDIMSTYNELCKKRGVAPTMTVESGMEYTRLLFLAIQDRFEMLKYHGFISRKKNSRWQAKQILSKVVTERIVGKRRRIIIKQSIQIE